MSACDAVKKLGYLVRVPLEIGRCIVYDDLKADGLDVDNKSLHQIGKPVRTAAAQHPRVVPLVPVAMVVVPHGCAVPRHVFEDEARLRVEAEVAVPSTDATNLGEDDVAVLIGADDETGLASGGTIERELKSSSGAFLAARKARVVEVLESHELVLPHLDCLQSQRVTIRWHKPSDNVELIHAVSLLQDDRKDDA